MSDKKLDEAPARELTSREIAKILGGLLGGLANMAPPETIFAALDFYTTEAYQPQHEAMWRMIFENAVQKGIVIPKGKI